MTFEKLNQIIIDNDIPTDIRLMSDSGWEVCETEMDGVYYNRDNNVIVFTQEPERLYNEDDNYERLF